MATTEARCPHCGRLLAVFDENGIAEVRHGNRVKVRVNQGVVICTRCLQAVTLGAKRKVEFRG